MRLRRALALTVLAVAAVPATARADGSIAGHVTDTTGPACIEVLDANGQDVARGPTAENGDYRLDGVPAGAWRVAFIPDTGCFDEPTSEARQYWHDHPTPFGADTVTVTDGQVTPGIDATLAPGGTITGTVVDARGAPIAGACAILQDTGGHDALRRLTDRNGVYVLDQLGAGEYLVKFTDDGCDGGAEHHQPQYYAGGATVRARAGQITSGIDAQLADVAPTPQQPPSTGPAPVTAAGRPSNGGAAVTADGTTAHRIPVIAPRGIVAVALRDRGRLDHARRLTVLLTCARGGRPCTGRLSVRVGPHVHAIAYRVPADGRPHAIRVGVGALRGRATLAVRPVGARVAPTVLHVLLR